MKESFSTRRFGNRRVERGKAGNEGASRGIWMDAHAVRWQQWRAEACGELAWCAPERLEWAALGGPQASSILARAVEAHDAGNGLALCRRNMHSYAHAQKRRRILLRFCTCMSNAYSCLWYTRPGMRACDVHSYVHVLNAEEALLRLVHACQMHIRVCGTRGPECGCLICIRMCMRTTSPRRRLT